MEKAGAVSCKDFLGNTVSPGDRVVALVKISSCGGLSDAYLKLYEYEGKDQWGYCFRNPENPETANIRRFKNPEERIIKIPLNQKEE